MTKLCPQCGNAVINQSDGPFKCDDCEKYFIERAYCPDCDAQLEKLQGCGATDYFCQNSHGLVSKKRVIWKLSLLD